ncbi:hypothetical protein ACFWIP_02945 [Streptomyces anulatus]|uniref:hypothetical protein n=1 Tax=Streptomyces anulatus TaxID=1892 RepID=UPI00366314B7
MAKNKTAVPSDVFSLDIDSLSLNEIESIEDIIDGPLDSLAKPGAKKARMLKAMAYVVKRREDPNFTIEDAGNLRVELKPKKSTGPTATNA